jgi:hypothetical protein
LELVITIGRIGTLDWLFTNVTADATYQFVGEGTHYEELPGDGDHIFEMRGASDIKIPLQGNNTDRCSHKLGHRISKTVRSFAPPLTIRTVQIAGVSVDVDDHLTKPPTFKKKVEIIGGSYVRLDRYLRPALIVPV